MNENINLRVEYIDINELNPYENNARKHGEVDINAIADSIRTFGFDDPVGIWGPNNTIVEGHGRVLAAALVGLTEIPCIRLDHLSDEERRAYALAHNRTAELSGWDFELRDMELAGVSAIDMSKFGFDDSIREVSDEYIDDFFDRGVEATEKAPGFEVRVALSSQEEVDECLAALEDAGFKGKQV